MSYTKNSTKRNNKSMRKGGVIFVAAIIGIFIAGFCRTNYLKEHFARNTVIQGADCSYFSIPKATEVVNEALSNETITLIFGEKQYQFQGKDFGIELSDSKELEKILADQQNTSDSGQNCIIQSSLKVNEDMVRKCLENIDELKTENMVKPQNAFIKISDDGTLGIENEMLGNEIGFDEAVAMCFENMSWGKTTIDFNLITNSTPEIVATNGILNENVNAVNHILSTVINFELTDGSIVTLDKETIKNWVCVDNDGIYYIEGSNIKDFVEELNSKVQEIENTTLFTPSDYDRQISLPVNSNTALSIDIEAEIAQIREELAEYGTYTRSPIYEQEIDVAQFPSYVEIDITRQQVWMYYEGECILDGVPCVTGNAGNHDTPTGLYYLTSKRRNAVLRGRNDNGTRYASPVSFWMPFNGNIGMHDASWRHGVFGADIYKTNGSHGCVNLRYEDAQIIYEHIEKNMPIIVYASVDAL